MTAVAPSRKASSVSVAQPDDRTLAFPYNRFNLNSYSTLASEPYGSFKILIAPKAVQGVPESNRLPAPDGKPFSLTFRGYVPKEVVKRGEWSPPAVTRLR